MAEALATAEPDTAPNIMQEGTLTCPRPPYNRPRSDSAQLTSVNSTMSPPQITNGQ